MCEHRIYNLPCCWVDLSNTLARSQISDHRLLIGTIALSPAHALEFYRALGSTLPYAVPLQEHKKSHVADCLDDGDFD